PERRGIPLEFAEADRLAHAGEGGAVRMLLADAGQEVADRARRRGNLGRYVGWIAFQPGLAGMGGWRARRSLRLAGLGLACVLAGAHACRFRQLLLPRGFRIGRPGAGSLCFPASSGRIPETAASTMYGYGRRTSKSRQERLATKECDRPARV